jgi:hypothetical protein
MKMATILNAASIRPLSLKHCRYQDSLPPISRCWGVSTSSPSSRVGGDAEHCREAPPVSGFDDVPVLSPVLGEGNMTGERSGTENMENIGRVEGVGDDREREEMSGTMINHAIGSR